MGRELAAGCGRGWGETEPVGFFDLTQAFWTPSLNDIHRWLIKEKRKSNASLLYSSYEQVPVYRKQWCFWLLYVLIMPIALGILAFGDVYYQKKDVLKSFGLANRIVAGLLGLYWLYLMGTGIFGVSAH